jgi:uncharacterized damage-inducible protein DinB
MNLNNLILKEFELRVFDENYARIFKCLNLISENDLWKSPNDNIPSVGNLILHLCGNARQWILSGLGGEFDNRNRNQEFIIQKNIRKTDLIFLMQNTKTKIQELFLKINNKDLSNKTVIQGFDTTYYSALIHVIEHFSYHTGQITFLTKLFTNQDTKYYEGIDFN